MRTDEGFLAINDEQLAVVTQVRTSNMTFKDAHGQHQVPFDPRLVEHSTETTPSGNSAKPVMIYHVMSRLIDLACHRFKSLVSIAEKLQNTPMAGRERGLFLVKPHQRGCALIHSVINEASFASAITAQDSLDQLVRRRIRS